MDHLLHRLISRSAETHPEDTAVEDGDRRLTYAAIELESNRVANLLVDVGVSRGDRVGLYLDKGLEAIVSIYGILKAGAGYVPLDPRAPTARLAYIASDCDLRVLVSGIAKCERWDEMIGFGAPVETVLVADAAVLDTESSSSDLNFLTANDVEQMEDSCPDRRVIDLDLAYILYTSGSTGQPKGVTLSHLNALTFVDWAAERFEIGSQDRLSSHAPLHFDLSVFDLFAAATAAAAVVLVPPELSVFPPQIRDFIDSRELTIWYSVPSVLSMLALRGGLREGDLPSLRTILFAGEVFPTKFLRQLMQALPHVEFHNLYGPTETNVCTHFPVGQIQPDRSEPIPIGRAIDGVEVFALTDDGSVAEKGEIGELCVRGTTVMHGYWGDEERSRRALIQAHVGGQLRDPAYRTGDLVRQDPNGDYLLLGRRDHQIKSRGYRIELGEVESAIYASPGVMECAVVAVPDPLVTNRIIAYVVGRDGLTVRDLLVACHARIPHYMVPERIELVDSLPKTSTGKVDRRALSPVPQ